MADHAAFDDFVRRVSPRLLGAARLIVGDHQRAQDLTQETLIRVYRAWGGIRELDSAQAYAYQTLVRLGHRQQRRKRLSEVLTSSLGEASLGQAVNGDVINAENSDSLRKCLEKLPARQRQTLVLRFYADFSVDRTASILGCTTGTVKSQTAKGLKALRIRLTSDSTLSAKERLP